MRDIIELENELNTNTEFHETVGVVSAALIGSSQETLNEMTQLMLKEIGLRLQVDRSYVFKFSENNETVSNTHEWCMEGIEPQIEYLQDIPLTFDPWWADQIFSNEIIHIANVDDMPSEAVNVQGLLKSQDIKSNLNVPIFIKDNCWGFIGFDAVTEHRNWSIFQVKYLKIVANLFAEAHSRVLAEEENRKIQEKLVFSNRMASIGIFTAGMAHEINNSLTILSGALQKIKKVGINSENQESLEKAWNSTGRISSIINELRKIAEKTNKSDELIDCNKVIKTTIENFSDVISQKSIQLTLTQNNQTSLIQGKEEMLLQLLSIVLENAIEASQNGNEIKITTALEAGNYEIQIQDFGRGIEEKKLNRIFDAFYTTKELGQGLGLNMFIAYNITQIFNGEIKIESSLGKGTNVTLLFPIVNP